RVASHGAPLGQPLPQAPSPRLERTPFLPRVRKWKLTCIRNSESFCGAFRSKKVSPAVSISARSEQLLLFAASAAARLRRDEPTPAVALAIPQQKTSCAIHSGCRSSRDRKSTRLNSSHVEISYAVFCL